MYKKMLRGIAFLLAICLVIQLVNVSAFAATQEKTFDSLDMKITFKVTSSWAGGYNAEVSINNPTTETYEDWALELATADEIANIWNAGIAKNEDGKYLVTNLGYNQDVKAGKTVSFGYTAKGSFTDYPEIQALKKDYVAVDESKYTVKYSVVSDWGSGANAEIAISNTSDEKLDEWKLTFDFGGNIANIWNAKIVSHEGNTYVIAGADYNQNLEAGATIKVGFTLANGSNGLKVENASLEQYDYVSEKDSFDDHEILEEIYVFSDTEEVFIDGQSETIYIYAICEDDTKTINLYEETLGLIGEMKDDGKYSVSGDDMSGDGILSAKYTIPSTAKRGQLKFYVSDGKGESDRVLIDVYVAFSNEEIEEMNYVQEFINNASDSLETAKEKYVAVKNACETLLAEGLIASYVESADMTKILIVYNTGVSWNISFVPLSYSSSGHGYDSGLPVGDQFDNYKANAFDAEGQTMIAQVGEVSYSREVRAVFIDMCEPSSVLNIQYGEPYNNTAKFFDISQALHDQGVSRVDYTHGTVMSLWGYYGHTSVINGYDIICVFAHGDIAASGEIGVYCTNENYDPTKYQMLTQSGAIGEASFKLDNSSDSKSVHCYMMYPKFFGNNIGDISGSFVSLLTCYSYGTASNPDDSLAKAYCNSGAKSVTCYKNSVNTNHALDQVGYYYAALLAGASSYDAYVYARDKVGYEHQGADGVKSYYEIYSNYTQDVLDHLVNGDFEQGPNKTNPWVKSGDVRILPRLGTTKAHKTFMAFISTGIGSQNGASGTEGSSLSQTVINKNNNKLSFYYDVFSEEPMEWVGSSYDDKFILQIRDLSGAVLYSEVLESVNTSEWIPCADAPKVDFEGGDSTAYHTYMNLNYKEILLPGTCLNKPIVITFIVCDVGDSAYDTAAVIDDVRLSN